MPRGTIHITITRTQSVLRVSGEGLSPGAQFLFLATWLLGVAFVRMSHSLNS